jgi:hypothetical protein
VGVAYPKEMGGALNRANQVPPITAAVGLALLVLITSCRDQPEEARLTSAPVVIGPVPVEFSSPQGLPTHGSDVALQVYLAPTYRRDSVRLPDGRSWGYVSLVDERGREIHMRASVIGASGLRTELGYARGVANPLPVGAFGERGAAARSQHPVRVEVVSTVPVRVDSVRWWAGDLYPKWGSL